MEKTAEEMAVELVIATIAGQAWKLFARYWFIGLEWTDNNDGL